MSATEGLLAVPAAWAAYAWGSHALTLGCVWRGSREGRRVCLTFDDGPDPEATPRVLDILSAHRITATFFLIGERAARHRTLVRRIVDAGHELGNHGWSHQSLWLAGPRRTADEVRRCHETIGAIAGSPPRFFRPAWGMTNLALFPILRDLATPCVFWSAQPESRRAVEPQLQISRGLARARPGAIFDLHDADGVPGAGHRLVQALPSLIGGLERAGYSLVPLRELL